MKPTMLTCWASPLPMMHSTISWSLSCFKSQRLGGNKKANTSFSKAMAFSSVVNDSCWDEMHFICFILWSCNHSFFLDISLLVLLLVCETGEYWGWGPSQARCYLMSLGSIIRSDHTRYTQFETKIKEMSESDPITLCYILDKSRTETMTQVILERD